MNQNYDVCIAGAGAAGLAAANALDPALRICIIDKNKIPGRKILVTGGGRCNLTNLACRRRDMTLDFFSGLGLETRCDEEGRYYPYSMVAADVVETLVRGLDGRNVDWRLEEQITGIRMIEADNTNRADEDEAVGYIVETQKTHRSGGNSHTAQIRAEKIIVCTGGKAAPKLGTTGDGYALARALGHTVTRTYPILTGINVEIPKEVSGVRARGQVSLLEDGKTVISESGEIQFTDQGISGICVFNLTPQIRIRPEESPEEGFARFAIEMDLAPDMSPEEVGSRSDSFGIVTGSVAKWIGPERLKNKTLQVRGVWGWEKAQCTAGGIPTEEVDEETMESLICPGLYFAGEIMDVQGPCGGFNLQHAWESGILAAKAINESLDDRLDVGKEDWCSQR